jgi:hypothetical protein
MLLPSLLSSLPDPPLAEIIGLLGLPVLFIEVALGKQGSFFALPVVELPGRVVGLIDFIGIYVLDCWYSARADVTSSDEADSSSSEARDVAGWRCSEVRLFGGPTLAHAALIN